MLDSCRTATPLEEAMVKQNMPFLIAVFLLVLYSGFLFGQVGSPAALRKTAEEYYRWRNENYPVNSSDQGLHTWDNRLTDYSQPALVSRQQYVRNLLAAVQAMQTTSWQREDRIDWLLFRSQLEQVAFFDRVIRSLGIGRVSCLRIELYRNAWLE